MRAGAVLVPGRVLVRSSTRAVEPRRGTGGPNLELQASCGLARAAVQRPLMTIRPWRRGKIPEPQAVTARRGALRSIDPSGAQPGQAPPTPALSSADC